MQQFTLERLLVNVVISPVVILHYFTSEKYHSTVVLSQILLISEVHTSMQHYTDLNYSINESIIYIYFIGIICGYFSTSLGALGCFMDQMLVMQYGRCS